jgi:hypothetical protein
MRGVTGLTNDQANGGSFRITLNTKQWLVEMVVLGKKSPNGHSQDVSITPGYSFQFGKKTKKVFNLIGGVRTLSATTNAGVTTNHSRALIGVQFFAIGKRVQVFMPVARVELGSNGQRQFSNVTQGLLRAGPTRFWVGVEASVLKSFGKEAFGSVGPSIAYDFVPKRVRGEVSVFKNFSPGLPPSTTLRFRTVFTLPF